MVTNNTTNHESSSPSEKVMNNSNGDDNILTLKDITFGYLPHKPVIEGINLDIPKGRFLGLLGPNGSGKTTLLKIMIGLHKPWHGHIDLGYDDTKTKKAGDFLPNSKKGRISSNTIGYVPQIESVDWNFPVTVTEVVGMGIWSRSGVFPWFNRNAKRLVQNILDSLGIGDYAKRQIRELSGGEQQRVFLARALIGNPEMLVLDEPTSGIDYNTREKILGVLTQLNLKGMTIILTTHDIAGIAKRLPWVVCMNKKIISQGPPNEILTSANLLKTYGLADNNIDNNSDNNKDNLLTGRREEFQSNTVAGNE